MTFVGMVTRKNSLPASPMSVSPGTRFAIADAANARKFTGVGFSMSGRFVQYLPLLSPERVEGMVIIAGAPASAMELPEQVIADWIGRAGDRDKLREVPVMFAVNP
jgi:pimeloyl-ACP methyl ester carboxylesterase